MRKIINVMSLFTLAMILFSCSKSEDNLKEVINLKVEGGGQVYLSSTSVEKEFTIKSEVPMSEDVVITLSTNVGDDVVKLDSKELIILKGENNIKSSVVFYEKKLGYDVDILFSSNQNVLFDNDKISYNVNVPDYKKIDGFKPKFNNYCVARWFRVGDYISEEHEVNEKVVRGYSDLTSKASANVFNGSICSVSFANLSSALTDDYIVGAWVDWNKDGKLIKSERVLYKEIKAKDQFTTQNAISTVFDVPDNIPDGEYIMRIGVSHNSNFNEGCGTPENGDMTDVKINFSKESSVEKPSLYIMKLGDKNIEVSDSDIDAKFELYLDRVSHEEIVVDLDALFVGEKGILSSEKITFAPGDVCKQCSVKFSTEVFDSEAKMSSLTITPKSDKVSVNTKYSKIEYIVKGVSKIEYKYGYSISMFSYQNGVVVSGADDHWLSVSIKTENGVKANKDLLFTPKIEGLLKNNYVINYRETPLAIKKGKSEVTFDLYVRGSSAGKDFVFSIISSNSKVIDSQKPINIEVREDYPAPILEDAKIKYLLDGKTDINEYTTNFMDLIFEATNGEIPACTILELQHTGDITEDDYYIPFAPKPFIIYPGNNKFRLRFKESIKGKKGTIKFISNYSTFIENAGINIDILE